MAYHRHTEPATRTAGRTCRSSPSGTSGCTSRAWARTTDHEVPIIVRGEGCYVYDEHGKRYLDGLSALFCVNAGHGRAELGEAAAEQAKELGFYTNWSYAHPRGDRAGRADRRARARRPEPRLLHLRRLARPSSRRWKLAARYHKLRGEPRGRR